MVQKIQVRDAIFALSSSAMQEILHRLGVKNRTVAVKVAVKQGWL